MPGSPLHRIETVITGSTGSPYYSRQFFDVATGSATVHANATRAFWDHVKTVIADNLLISVQAEVAVVDGITGAIQSIETVTAPQTVTGTSTSSQLPYANQGMCRLNTGVYLGGRQVRGRIYIPGLTQTANADGQISAAYASTVTIGAAALRNAGLVVYSDRWQQWHPVSTVAVPGKVAVLRSRRD